MIKVSVKGNFENRLKQELIECFWGSITIKHGEDNKSIPNPTYRVEF